MMMLTEAIYYHEERRYALERFIVYLLLTLIAFGLFTLLQGPESQTALGLGFVLAVVDFINLGYYYAVIAKPESFAQVRRIAIIALDIAMITYAVGVTGAHGIYLLGLYLAVLVRVGLGFGPLYGYIVLALILLGSVGLWYRFAYWHTHVNQLIALIGSAVLVTAGMLRIVIELHRENAELEEVYDEEVHGETEDRVTGLPTRVLYKETLRSLTHGTDPFTLLFIDLNRLASVTELHGSDIGNEVLRETVDRIKKHLTQEDTLIRMSDSELALLSTRNPLYIEKFVAKLTRSVPGRHKVGNTVVPIEIRVGISRFPDDAKEGLLLGKYADMALFAAKEDESRYYFFYHELSAEQKEAYAQR